MNNELDIQSIEHNWEKDLEALPSNDFRLKYLSRKSGLITQALKALSGLVIDQKRILGPKLQRLASDIEHAVEEKEKISETIQADITVPASFASSGSLHPLTQTSRELEKIFLSLGFDIALGPEVETEWHNFTALNIPSTHPARDMWDTFYIADETDSTRSPALQKADSRLLLRTHTSPVQIRYMQSHTPPFKAIFPGTVYRQESTDATHEHTFGQLEGLVVGKKVTFGQLRYTVEQVLKRFFGSTAQVQLRPSFFPFVEPGAEAAVRIPGYRGGQWIELLGCGMVHQKVLEAAGYKSDTYQGFAFGFGLSRFSLMKYGIPDIRLFAENSPEFISQFK